MDDEGEEDVDIVSFLPNLNMSAFIRQPPPKDTEARLLRVLAAATIFSAVEEDFAFFVEANDAPFRLNELTFQMSPASMNFGCRALSLVTSLSNEIKASSGGAPNAPPSAEQRRRAKLLRATWRKMIDVSSLRTFDHPRLGKVPVVQPLLFTLIQWRGAGMGNGDGATPDPVFEQVLAAGARVDLVSSLGLSTMHNVVEACQRVGDDDDERSEQNRNLARLLLDKGASVLQTSEPVDQMDKVAYVHNLEGMLATGRRFNAVEACDWLASQTSEGAESLRQLKPLLQEAAAVQAKAPPRAPAPVPGAGTPGWRDRAYHPSAQKDMPPATTVQAISNVLWLTSRLTAMATASARRAAIVDMAATAPFRLPLCCVVPFPALVKLGRLPRRDTTRPQADWSGPVPVSALDDAARVIFISHRWLSPNGPDDADGSKFAAIVAGVQALAASMRVALGSVYLWLDFSSVDQADPLPAVQMLPAYMACCDEFLYIAHSEYRERAWCRTELFFNWRLKCQGRRWRVSEDGTLTSETPEGSADPAAGLLYSEGDRVALVNMTAFFSLTD